MRLETFQKRMSSFNNITKTIGVYCERISILPGLGILFLATIWCLYFLSRIRELSRKIHYLKKQTEERCYEELTNAKVDYIKSIFIAAICFFEVSSFVCFCLGIAEHNLLIIKEKENKLYNCSNVNVIENFKNFTFTRILFAMDVSSLLLYTSLVHILTSYLCHAYAEKRIITLTRRDKVLISYLLIQLVVIGISIVYWRAFVFTALMMITTLFPIHLCLYVKYSRRLYMLLKRRRLDAWFEDPDSYKKLVGMCKEYKTGSILYTVSIVLIIIGIFLIVTVNLVETVFTAPCVLNLVFFNIKFNWLHKTYQKHEALIEIFFNISKIILSFFGVCMIVFVFALHFYILYKAIKRLWKRRIAYKNCTREMYRPLLVSN